MVLTVVDFDANILSLVSREDSTIHAVEQSCLHRWHKVARDDAADDGIDKEEIVILVVLIPLHLRESRLRHEFVDVNIARKRIHPKVNLTKLSPSPRLFLVAIAAFSRRANRFTKWNLRIVCFQLHFVASAAMVLVALALVAAWLTPRLAAPSDAPPEILAEGA